MRYILGIDTTFHTSGVGLVDENGKVLVNQKVDLDFTNENAEKFFNFHNKNTLSLIKPLLDEYLKDIFLISAVSQEGTFHAMPVGAIIANTLSYFLDKKIIGVNHEIAHLYSNWLERDKKDFLFPIVSLNISGAHSNIYLIRSHQEIEKVSEIIWRDEQEKFGGLGALFDRICVLLNIKISTGEGGLYLEKLARLGKPKYYNDFKSLRIEKNNKDFKFENIIGYISEKIKTLGYYSFKEGWRERFQRDVATSILNVLFDSLVIMLREVAKEFRAKEIHLAGGVAANVMLNHKVMDFCKSSGLNFKAPLKPEFCGDNGAMTAIAGYYQWQSAGSSGDKEFLTIEPSNWYYKYYAKYFSP
jgi:N6-L-threonylcarbamoyladenine synthase